MRVCEGDITEAQLPNLQDQFSRENSKERYHARTILEKNNKSDGSFALYIAFNSSYEEKALKIQPPDEAIEKLDRRNTDKSSGSQLFCNMESNRGPGKKSKTYSTNVVTFSCRSHHHEHIHSHQKNRAQHVSKAHQNCSEKWAHGDRTVTVNDDIGNKVALDSERAWLTNIERF